MERFWRGLARVAPGEAFLAVTAIDGPQPRFVAGFSFVGKRREVEALLAEPREEFRRRWPAGTSGSTSHKGAAIETFTYPQGLLAECFVRNWYFVASDATLLRATLDRYENPSSATAAALMGDEIFQKATAPLGSGPDVMLFSRIAGLGALMPAVGKSANQKEPADAKKMQAIAACTRIEGAQMRDTVFILSPREANEPPLSRSTLALGGPETFLYFAMGVASLAQIPESITPIAAALPGVAAIEKALAERKLEWSDFEKVFGPEIGMMVEWPDQALAPAPLLAGGARFCKGARFHRCVTGGRLARRRGRTGGVGRLHYSAPVEGLTLTNPTIAITPACLLGFAQRRSPRGARIDAAIAGTTAGSPFQEYARRATPPTSGFGYLDAAALFERAYKTLRPALAMSLAFSEELGDYMDAGKLPSSQTISKHLTPSVFSQSTTRSGILMESTGTLTFNQLAIGTIASAAAAFPARAVRDGHDRTPSAPGAKPAAAGEIPDPLVSSPEDPARRDPSAAKEPEPAIPARP